MRAPSGIHLPVVNALLLFLFSACYVNAIDSQTQPANIHGCMEQMHLAGQTVTSKVKLHESIIDSLLIKETERGHRVIKQTCDSLCASDTNPALISVKKSLKLIQQKSDAKVKDIYFQWHEFLQANSQSFFQTLFRLQGSAKFCQGCNGSKASTDCLDEFNDTADVLVDALLDTLMAVSDDDTAALHDTLQEACDSLKEIWESGCDKADSLKTLIDSLEEAARSRTDSIDAENEDHSNLLIQNGYQSHITYRGRDFGVAQPGITPELQFYHRTGFSIDFAPTWFQKYQNNWNEFYLSFSYEHKFSKLMSGSINYEHIWFADTNLHDRSDLNNGLNLDICLQPGQFEFEFVTGLDFGLLTEFNIQVNGSYIFDAGKFTYPIDLILKPMVTGIYGQENKTFFGVLDYEFSLSATIGYKWISLSPVVTYIIPLNVHDDSDRKPFLSAGGEIGISLDLFSVNHSGRNQKKLRNKLN